MADFQEHHTQRSIDKHKPVNSRNDCVLGSMLEPPAAIGILFNLIPIKLQQYKVNSLAFIHFDDFLAYNGL